MRKLITDRIIRPVGVALCLYEALALGLANNSRAPTLSFIIRNLRRRKYRGVPVGEFALAGLGAWFAFHVADAVQRVSDLIESDAAAGAAPTSGGSVRVRVGMLNEVPGIRSFARSVRLGVARRAAERPVTRRRIEVRTTPRAAEKRHGRQPPW